MRKSMSDREFPLLRGLGLYAADIRGDGNCLFNALADQLYGSQAEHHSVRARVIAHMRAKMDYYKQFIDVNAGGGRRCNPKRKNAGGYSSTSSMVMPTEEEIGRVFEAHLLEMAKGGTYGDNMELSAFSSAFQMDVKIYHHDYAYVVSPAEPGPSNGTVYIAYHTWEHYSSVRNLVGPHAGPPLVREGGSDETSKAAKPTEAPVIAPWMIEVVLKSLPYPGDRLAVKRILEENQGDVDATVSRLLDDEEAGSDSGHSSIRHSPSVEREADGDDDALINGPNKKQDRRLSRSARTTILEGRKPSKAIPSISVTAESASDPGSGNVADSGSDQLAVKGESVSSAADHDGSDWLPGSDAKTASDDHTSRHSASVESAGTTPDGSGLASPVPIDPSSPPAPIKVDGEGTAVAVAAPDSPSIHSATAPPQKEVKRLAEKKGTARPAQKRMTARDKKDLKKSTQKNAAKKAKRDQATASKKGNTAARKAALKKGKTDKADADSATSQTNASGTGAATTTLSLRIGKENSPVLSPSIKTFYI